MIVPLDKQPASSHASQTECCSNRGDRPCSASAQAWRLSAGGRCGGFTLVEVVTSITVGVIISGIAGTLIWNASRQRAEVSARSELIDLGSAAMEIMLRYIREIPQGDDCPLDAVPCLNGEAAIDVASSTELRFGDIGFRFTAETMKLEMTTNGTTIPANWYSLATDVMEFAFVYYDRCGQPTTSAPEVRRVRIALKLSRGVQITALATSIYLRSFMDEWETDASCD